MLTSEYHNESFAIGDTLEFRYNVKGSEHEGPIEYAYTVKGLDMLRAEVQRDGGGLDISMSLDPAFYSWRHVLRAGCKIHISHMGVKLAHEFTVTTSMENDYVCDYASGFTFILPKYNRNYTWSALPLVPVEVGSQCRRCGEYNEYAEPTKKEDRTHVCWGCRQGWWGDLT